MATLASLKRALRQEANSTASSPKQPLSDLQYSAGFDVFEDGPGLKSHLEFTIPQLSKLLSCFDSRNHISVLEIGPGPKSVLGYLPGRLRRKVRRYTAFEPNVLFAIRLAEWLCPTSKMDSPLPCLGNSPDIRIIPFNVQDELVSGSTADPSKDEKYDIILFCHSMYGMKPKHQFIRRALEMLVERPQPGLVAVFHREGTFNLDGLVCHRSASFLHGVIYVEDDDKILNSFAPFIAGFIMQDVDMDNTIRDNWRKVCRALGRHDDTYPGHLAFSAPDVLMAFTRHATTLPELTADVPVSKGDIRIKNSDARFYQPASTVRPTEILHIQKCTQWALKHGTGLTVVSGSHSGHCRWPNVVSIDMSAFDKVHVLTTDNKRVSGPESRFLVVAEAGCNTGDIIRKTIEFGVTVPLGSRPSVGAGLWLQGGIGHTARLKGLTCDSIVGAVLVGVASGDIFYVGCVPRQHRPAGATRPENEDDLLWAIKGAGTNFGIVISVTFRSYTAPTYLTRSCVLPLPDNHEGRLKLNEFAEHASKLRRNCSADAYLYWDAGQLHLGVTTIETSTTSIPTPSSTNTLVDAIGGVEQESKTVDGVGLFESEMYVSGMHGGHGGGKTSSFKRCLFLKNIGDENVAHSLLAAVETCPSPLCYLHLLQGGGAVGDIADDTTAFSCRDWDFACIITGIWPREQDNSDAARYAMQWVYTVVEDLLSLSAGVYSADLGPDPRDQALAVKAFGSNGPRLADLKHLMDPHHVLAYACPLPKAPRKQKLIILVTGESCAGKDYCANVWGSVFNSYVQKSITARVVSISDVTKQKYAAATGADLGRLLCERTYKEQHRSALTTFFQRQVWGQPQLLEEHFLSLVRDNADVDALLITGMREKAPVAALSHLVHNCRLIEVNIQASEQTRQIRRGETKDSYNSDSSSATSDHITCLVFDNDTAGDHKTKEFAIRHLLPYFHEDLQRLAAMARPTPDFPHMGVDFRHVLDIAQQPGGLALCTSLLQTYFTGDWARISAVVCCEVGGIVFASALASRVDVPLVLIRGSGRLPPPTVSVPKLPSHISSLNPSSKKKRIEMGRNAIPNGASVMVVDDVLATGETLFAVLQLLEEAGVRAEKISVMVVAEFPIHCGRQLLRQRGFGGVHVQSLLVFGGS
jgi:adenine phosphoribosyltransferase